MGIFKPLITEAKVVAYHDRIKGGLADKRRPEDFDQRQLRIGIKIEREHTSNRRIAMEIAMDHLSEDPNYYKKLRKIEKR